MADHISITAEHDGTLTNNALRDALTGLDVSDSSPVTPSGRGIGTAISDGEVTISVSGTDGGDFTKTSTQALRDAIVGLDEVDERTIEVEGGYQPE